MAGFAKKVVIVLWLLCIYHVRCEEEKEEEEQSEKSEGQKYAERYPSWITSPRDEFRAEQARLMKLYMNDSADPCENFYEYACGNWAANNPRPEEDLEGAFSVTSVLEELQSKLLQNLVGSDVDDSDSEAEIKVKEFFKTCKSTGSKRFPHLRDFLDSLGSWPIFNKSWTPEDLEWIVPLGKAKLYNVDVFFRLTIQEGWGEREFFNEFDVPEEPDYYEDAKGKTSNYRSMLNKASHKLNPLKGYIADMAERIATFEKKLFQLVELHSEGEPTDYFGELGEVSSCVSGFPIVPFLQAISDKKVPSSRNISVENCGYFADLVDFLDESDPRTVVDYIFFRVAYVYFQFGPKFHSLFDEPEKCMKMSQELMESAVTRLFIKTYFPAESKEAASDLIERVRRAGLKSLNESEWFDPQAKKNAIDKLSAVEPYVGYLDYMASDVEINRDFAGVTINKTNFVQTVANLNRNLVKLGQQKTVDANTHFTVIEVNAFYSQKHSGKLIFPAAQLQAPFYHLHSPAFLNYAATGAVVGHEFMHGFDTDNIHHDATGKLQTWWNERHNWTYLTRTSCFYSQYEKYGVERLNLTVDGGRTLAENLSDNEGLKMGFLAYKDWLESTESSTESELKHFAGFNLTPTQLYFLGFAQSWCNADYDARLKYILESDSHTPDPFRIIGALSNSKEFSEQFKCPVGTAYNPEKKCKYLRK